MGTKGEKLTNASTISAENLQNSLSPLGDIRIRKMFGGHGVFIKEKMFALVDSKGGIFFKVDDTIVALFEDAGSNKHGRMPYYQVPAKVLADEKILQEWAQSSITVAKNAKRFGFSFKWKKLKEGLIMFRMSPYIAVRNQEFASAVEFYSRVLGFKNRSTDPDLADLR
jgi:DNA transformation protein